MSRREWLQTLLVIMMIVVPVMIVRGLVTGLKRDPRARTEANLYLDHLALGMTPAEVRGAFEAGKFKRLSLSEETMARWVVTTPIEWDGNNWKIFILFDEAKVAALLTRTANSARAVPEDGPSDLVAPEYEIPREYAASAP